MSSAFYDDLNNDLQDPAFAAAYATEQAAIETHDRLLNLLDVLRLDQGVTISALADQARLEPRTVERLLTKGHSRPTIETIAKLASVLGYQLTLKKIGEDDGE